MSLRPSLSMEIFLPRSMLKRRISMIVILKKVDSLLNGSVNLRLYSLELLLLRNC